MHVRKRIFTFLFAALAMLLCTACGKWDYSREAVKAANEAQGETLRVEFKVNQTFTNALRAAAEDNIQPNNVDNAMTMDKSIEKLLTSGYRLDVYALRADTDADQAAAQLADEFVSRLAGCEDEGYIGMVKADNNYFYMAVLTYKHDSGSSDGGAGDDGNTGGGVIDTSWVSWDGKELRFMKGAGDADHVGTSLEKADESKVKETLIARGELSESEDFAFASKVVNLVIDEDSGITTINNTFNTYLITYPAYHIGSPNTTLQSAKLYSITTIGEDAFNYCKSLTTVILPDSDDITIGFCAFYGCSSLTEIDASITSIGIRAFYECTALTTVNFSSVASISESAFYGCDGLTEIDLSSLPGNGSASLGESAFSNCAKLEKVTLPGNITYINDEVFAFCDKLSSIDLSHVTHIGKGAFHYSDSLSDINIENVTEVGKEAFAWCKSLTRINLGTDSKTIGESAFSRIGDFKIVTIFYGAGATGEDVKNQLLDNLTVPGASSNADLLDEIGLTFLVTAHYQPAASYTPSTTAYSIPNPAARFILNL